APLAGGDERANAGPAIADHERPRLLARHEQLTIENDDRAVAAACDALYQQLPGGGEDLTGGRVELGAGVGHRDMPVAGAVVRLEDHRQPEPPRVRVGASDVAHRAKSA